MEQPSVELKRHSRGLFAAIDGAPAHVLIILGLALTILTPVIMNLKSVALASANAEHERIKTLRELEIEEFKRQQDADRKKSPTELKYKQALEQRKSVIFDLSLPPEDDKNLQEMKKAVEEKEKESAQALQDKQDEVNNKYDTVNIRREITEAQTAVAGTRSHLIVGWLGRVLLLVGLLVLTIQSEGLRQKVILIVLLVVMFSALSGIHLDFQAQGRMGEPPGTIERTPGPATTAKP